MCWFALLVISKVMDTLVAIPFLKNRKSISVLLSLKCHLHKKVASSHNLWILSFFTCLSCSSISARNLAIVSTSSPWPEPLYSSWKVLDVSLKSIKSECLREPFWSCWPPKWHRCWRRSWWLRRRWQRCESGSSRSPIRQKVVASSSRRLRRPEWPFNKLF